MLVASSDSPPTPSPLGGHVYSPSDVVSIIAVARRLPAAELTRLLLGLLGLPDLPEWLTYGEAALALRKSRATVCRLVRAGRLRDNGRHGHARRVSRESVLALLTEATRNAQATVARILEKRRLHAGCMPRPIV